MSIENVVNDQSIELSIISNCETSTSNTQHYSDAKNRNDKMSNTLARRPWFIWFISIVQIGVFIAELGISWSLTGIPIQMKPSFNPIIGPSVYILINMGARFGPCMYAITNITDDGFLGFPCPNYTGLIEQNLCTLSELCGFGGVSIPPNQWYRFIISIFLHGGLIHIAGNISSHWSLGTSVEKIIGTLRMIIIYFASGIFGSIASGNFAPNGTASVGSGSSLFGLIALYLLYLLFNWHRSSCRDIIRLIFNIIVVFASGLSPNRDNFGHVGGFVMGLLLGLVILNSPNSFRRRRKETTEMVSTKDQRRMRGFFYNRLGKWCTWWIFCFIILAMAIIIFVLAILNIYLWKVRCSWCKYISCLPVDDWCELGQLSIIHINNSTV